MDLAGYWQENKRFVLTVGGGALLFLVGFALENALFRDELDAMRHESQGFRNKLEKAPYGPQDLADAEAENATLRAAVDRLAAAAGVRVRPEFVPDPATGSPSNHYLRTLARVREELQQRCNRASLDLDSSLGMPELSPTIEDQIVRYLEALDVVETVVDLALRARAERIDKIQVRLDPGHGSREGVGTIERTRIVMSLAGSPLALARVLAWTQRPPTGGRVLSIDQFEMITARGKSAEVRLDVTFVVARVKDRPAAEAEG